MSDEDAFWETICANLADALPRLVYSEWLGDQNRWDEAAAVRACKDKYPDRFDFADEDGGPCPHWTWWHNILDADGHPHSVPPDVFDALTKPADADEDDVYRDYPTARAALEDLHAAWVAVNVTGVECGACKGVGQRGEITGDTGWLGSCPDCAGTGRAVPAGVRG